MNLPPSLSTSKPYSTTREYVELQIQAAIEAYRARLIEGIEWPKPDRFDYENDCSMYAEKTVETLISAAVLRERERCAVVCEKMAYVNPQRHQFAYAIRKGETE